MHGDSESARLRDGDDAGTKRRENIGRPASTKIFTVRVAFYACGRMRH
jgi:hypothetical protein